MCQPNLTNSNTHSVRRIFLDCGNVWPDSEFYFNLQQKVEIIWQHYSYVAGTPLKVKKYVFLVTIMGFCGNLQVSICGNFKSSKIASAEGFELFSCLLKADLTNRHNI